MSPQTPANQLVIFQLINIVNIFTGEVRFTLKPIILSASLYNIIYAYLNELVCSILIWEIGDKYSSKLDM